MQQNNKNIFIIYFFSAAERRRKKCLTSYELIRHIKYVKKVGMDFYLLS